MLESVQVGKKRRRSPGSRIIQALVDPLIIPRAEHTISRSHIDTDALKVLYRLRKFNHVAYLVGGGVRDLLLGRHPKDFDIGTSANPSEIKRIFRNCWIIGRRFRLVHVKFGLKTIEVATFRRKVPLETSPAADSDKSAKISRTGSREGRRSIRRDNTFGTAEEDAFRRDFTVNALFCDISNFSVIDYVGGVSDLRKGIIRSIGDPNERFIEDPVRMLRAISFASRLGFRLDDRVRRAIAKHKAEIANTSPARMLEELYKLLRSGVSAKVFRSLSRTGLLKHIAPEIEKGNNGALWRSLRALDHFRNRFKDIPSVLTNPILLGSLVLPVQSLDLTPRRRSNSSGQGVGIALGELPIARKDVERLRDLLRLQVRLLDVDFPQRMQRAVIHRGAFDDAMTWLEIHGANPESLARWRTIESDVGVRRRKTPSRGRRLRRRRTRKVESK